MRFPVKNRVTAILARFAPSPRAAKEIGFRPCLTEGFGSVVRCLTEI